MLCRIQRLGGIVFRSIRGSKRGVQLDGRAHVHVGGEVCYKYDIFR